MDADSTSNDDIFLEQEEEAIYADLTSLIPLNDNNFANPGINGDGNTNEANDDGGGDKIDDPKHNNDRPIVITQKLEKGKAVYVDPISWIPPNDNNISIVDGGCDDKNDDPKQNDDGNVIISPSKEIVCLSTASTKKTRTPKTLPKEYVDNWEVKEKLRNDGIKVDKSYRHKKEGFTCRSLIEVEEYEKNATRPSRKRKTTEKGKEMVNAEKEQDEEKLSKKKKEDAEINRIRVEEFLAEAHYNLLHWFDS